MTWLVENPIANMYGPHFLVLYGVVIVLTLGACWLTVHRKTSWYLGEVDSGEESAKRAESRLWRVRILGALVIAGSGGYKLVVALSKGHRNVLFLILMGVVGLGVLFCIRAEPPREGKERL